jgi:hypothetical protein
MTGARPREKNCSIKAPIAALPQLYSALINLPGRLGFGEAKWERLCAEYAEAECELCGIKITGTDLARFAESPAKDQLDDPRLQRLFLHYCARNTCDCRYYRFIFKPHPEIDWAETRIALQDSLSLLPGEEPRPARFTFDKHSLLQFTVTAVAALLAVFLLILLHHSIYGGRIPLFQKPHIYKTNPSLAGLG